LTPRNGCCREDARHRSVRLRAPSADCRARPTKRINGYRLAFTGGISDWPRNRRLYPLVRRLGGEIVEAENISAANYLIQAEQMGDERQRGSYVERVSPTFQLSRKKTSGLLFTRKRPFVTESETSEAGAERRGCAPDFRRLRSASSWTSSSGTNRRRFFEGCSYARAARLRQCAT
jgi:hypothetical protein